MRRGLAKPLCTILVLGLSLTSLISCGNAGGCSDCGTGIIPPFNLYYSVVVADLNGDGRLDLAACYSKIAGSPPHPGVVAVFLQDPARAGSFLSPVNYGVGNDPVALAVGDLNGDGKPDLVAVNTITNASGTGESNVTVLLQDASNPGHFLPGVNYDTGFSPVGVAIGDVNGDGKPDLAVADTTGVSILLQDPSVPGQFLPRTTIAMGGGGASSVALADLNGDHKLDLVATGTDLNVFLQNSGAPGTFLPPVHYSVGPQPISIAVADFDGDGLPDLAVANLGTPDDGSKASVSVLLQNPALPGAFFPATNYATGYWSLMVTAADLNGDGKPDLAVANMGAITGSSVSVLLQNPGVPGTFQPTTNYSEGSAGWVSVGDIDGDGRNDLAIADSGVVIRLQDPANPGKFLDPVVVASE